MERERNVGEIDGGRNENEWKGCHPSKVQYVVIL